MKQLLLHLLSLCLVSVSLTAQVNTQASAPELRQAQATFKKELRTGMEAGSGLPAEHFGKPQRSGPEKIDQEIQVGQTIYDLQSNSTNCNRISIRPDGRIAATWTQGFDDSAYPDRGTGYNSRINFAWNDIPTERIESVRTGWPNHVFTASGAEFIVSHSGDYDLVTSRRTGPLDPWTESAIPTNTPNGILWPRAAVGGANGETIHVIAITAPDFLDGAPYQEVDGHILYYRSIDGGANWDMTDIALDGLGTAFTAGSDSDSYYIDARGDVVAFAVFNSFDDLLLFKSTDNGQNWEKTIVNDFPLERYVTDAGYSYEDLPPFMGERPDSLAIFTSDGFGTLLLDHSGVAHVFFGNMWVQDDDLVDGGTTYYPGTDGISYWNENFVDSGSGPRTILGTVDQNGNDTLDIVVDATGVRVGTYFSSLTTMPSAGIDAAGNIYLTYSGIIEGPLSIDDDMQHYRHVYVTASQDNGETWADPVDLIQEDIVLEPDLYQYVEGVFPTMARDIVDKVRLIYMQDFRPGLAVRGDEDEAADNFINYIQLDVAELGVVRTEELVDPTAFGLTLAPNVTKDLCLASFELTNAGPVSISLVNMHGQLIRTFGTEHLPAGLHQRNLDLSTYSSGVYYLIVRMEKQYAAVEVIKQ